MTLPRRLIPLAFALGCARPAIIHPRTSAAPPAPVQPTPPASPAPGRLRRSTYGSPGTWWVDAHRDPRRALISGWRTELRGAVVTGAEGWIDSPMAAAWQHGGRWHFAGRAEHWESESFLGRATLATSVTQGALGLGGGRVVRLRDGAADGIGLPPVFALDAAFTDDLHGIAIVEPGVVLRTEDGGQRWSTVPLPGDVPREVVASGDMRWVRGDLGCFALDGDALRSSACADLPLLTTEAAIPDEAREPFMRARAARLDWEPLAFTDRSQRRVLVSMPGLRDRRSSEVAWIYDLDRDEAVSGSESTLPCAENLASAFTADRPYVVCRGGEGTYWLWSREDDGHWRVRLHGSTCAYEIRCAASASGARVACSGTCAEGETCATGGTVCERDGAAPARAWSVGSDVRAWRIGGYDGEALVQLDQRAWLAHAEVILDHAAPVPLIRRPAMDGFRITGEPQVGTDGVLRLWATRADGGDPIALEGHPGGTFSARVTPPWERTGRGPSFSYCGADGVAWAEAPDRMWWRSREAGDEWEPLLPDGSRYAALLRSESAERHGSVYCDAMGWTIHGNAGLHAVGWGPVEPPRDATVPVAREVAETWRRPVTHAWRCRQEGPDGSRSQTTGYTSTLGPYPGLVRATRGGAAATFWDFRGVTALRSSPTVFRYRDVPPDGALRWDYAPDVLWADARHAVLLLSNRNDRQPGWHSRLLEMTATAPPRVLGDLPTWSRGDYYASGPSTLVAHSGDVVGALSVISAREEGSTALTRTVGFLSMRSGAAPEAQRVVVNATGSTPGVFVLDGRAGVVRWGTNGTLLGGPPNELPHVLARRASFVACGPAARGSFVLPSSTTLESFDEERAVEEYALEGEVACLRAVRSEWSIVGPTPTGIVGIHRGGTHMRCALR